MELEERVKIIEDLFKTFLGQDAKDWLKRYGYYTAPCSTKYHLAKEGGLFEHSLNVANALVEFTKNEKLKWERPESPFIIGLFHDLCKHDSYIFNPVLNKYEWNKDQQIYGHGDKSVILIEKHLCKLTDEEKACVLYHMGSFTEKQEWSKYTEAIHKHKNVLFTHMADMYATHILEVSDEEKEMQSEASTWVRQLP